MNDNKNKRNKILKIAGLIGLFLLVFGISFALFTVTLNGTKKNRITTGSMSIKLTEMDGTLISTPGNDYKTSTSYMINLENQIPISDSEGKEIEGYQYKLVNDGTVDARYKLYLKVPSSVTLDAQYIKFDLEQDGEKVTFEPELLSSMESSTVTDSDNDTFTLYKIDGDLINHSDDTTYKLRLWVDEDADNAAMDKEFIAWLYVDAQQKTSSTNPFKDDTIAYAIYRDNPKPKRLDSVNATGFDTTYGETAGLYSTTDMNGGDTYFYRGPVENNYFKKEGQASVNAFDRFYRVREDGTVIAPLLSLQNASSYSDVSNSFVHYKDSNIYTVINQELQQIAAQLKAQPTTWCSDSKMRTNADYNSIFLSDLESGYTANLMGPFSKLNLNGTTLSEIESAEGDAQIALIKKVKFDIDLSCRAEDKYQSAFSEFSAWDAVLAGYGFDGGSSFFNLGFDVYLNSMAVSLTDGTNYEENAYVLSSGGISTTSPDNRRGIFVMYSFPKNIRVLSGNGTEANPYVLKDYYS